jgi:hypothetical protein
MEPLPSSQFGYESVKQYAYQQEQVQPQHQERQADLFRLLYARRGILAVDFPDLLESAF